ncbi:DUF4286 family protein [Portibacter marinus]|uniref:DUF4286 family protein n=1 Tax=Portibacter marinus TaxID=2898660 RepID=UPI001F39B76E|nr:DUF4286 family protein [Portibacter marinus]
MSEHNIIYNVTIKVDKKVEAEWYDWMKSVHIPDVMQTGCFIESRFNKILYVDDDEGSMYTVQYTLENLSQLQKYHVNYAPKLQKAHQDRYQDQCVAFRSVMEIKEKFE